MLELKYKSEAQRVEALEEMKRKLQDEIAAMKSTVSDQCID